MILRNTVTLSSHAVFALELIVCMFELRWQTKNIGPRTLLSTHIFLFISNFESHYKLFRVSSQIRSIRIQDTKSTEVNHVLIFKVTTSVLEAWPDRLAVFIFKLSFRKENGEVGWRL